jgi:hypothetical protein
MKWFGRVAIKPNHFKSEERMATALPKIWPWMFSVGRSAFLTVHEREHEHEDQQEQQSFESGLAISFEVVR